jgi:hypothetical protein
MKNLFFVPFAFDENKMTGVNVKNNAQNTYLKNLCVSLISAKKTNPDIDVALVSNIRIPLEYEQLLSANQVCIYLEPFDSFVFADDYLWCLAFYKLCALEKMVSKYDYDNYIYTDADVFVQRSLDKVFMELRDIVLLYDINHGLTVKDYEIIVDEFNKFGVDSYITHYGGEFVGASRDNAKKLVDQCKQVYAEMLQKNFVTTKGDEFIISIAAYRMRDRIKNAGAYIFRFWTGDFYLVSTCYKYNEVAILHLPGEKQKGMLKLYEIFAKKHAFPNKEKIHRICHLTGKPMKVRIKSIVKKILSK